MHPSQPDGPAHLVAALGRVPEEAAELLVWIGAFPGPDLPTSIIVQAMSGNGLDEEPVDPLKERVAQILDLLHGLARQGLIARAPDIGPERWTLDPEQGDFARRLAAAKIASDQQEINSWAENATETPERSEESPDDLFAATMEELFGQELRIYMAQELQTMSRESGDRHREAVATNNLGHVLCDFGRYSEAVGLLEAAERLYAETGDHVWSARAREKLEEARRLSES